MRTWQDRLLELLDKSEYKTMTELCRVAGIATSTFSTALKGSHTPKTKTLDKVAKVLGTTSQYILNGEDNEEPVMMHEIPVLSAEQISDWLSLRLKISTIENRIRPPRPVSKLSFAWTVDTVDMAPFQFGCTVVLDPDFNLNRRHISERIYVLVSKKRPMVHQVSFSDIENIIQRAEAGEHEPSGIQDYENYVQHTALVELAKTVCGYEFISTEPRTNRVMDFAEYQIVGRVRYAIHDY